MSRSSHQIIPSVSCPLVIVIPVYGAVNSLSELLRRLTEVWPDSVLNWHVIFVDDRSPSPNSWRAIVQLADKFKNVHGIRLLKNRGRASAVLCGLSQSRLIAPSSFVVVMDDDLQHDPNDIPALLGVFRDDPNCDVVIAQFSSKKHSALAKFGSWLKSWLDRFYYGLPQNVKLSSFVALHPGVVDALIATKPSFPLFGAQLIKIAGKFRGVNCKHHARFDGVPAFTLSKRIRLLLSILFGDTKIALVAFHYLGTTLAIGSMALGVYFMITTLIYGNAPAGWASTVLATIFLGSLNLILLSLIGTIVIDAKQSIERFPAWSVRETTGFGEVLGGGERN